jgi:hypothetical protein
MQVVIKAFQITTAFEGAWATQAIIGYNNWRCLICGISSDEFYPIQNKILFFCNGLKRVLNRETFINYYQQISCGS